MLKVVNKIEDFRKTFIFCSGLYNIYKYTCNREVIKI